MRSCRPFLRLWGFVKSKTKVFQFVGSAYVGLFGVDFQPEFLLYPFGYGVHNSVGARTASYCYHAVVGITDVVQPSSYKLLVKFVEHHVAQKWR